MAANKKQQIRGVRIALSVFYGFLLSSILFRYLLHGLIETIEKPTNPYAIALLVIGVLILVSIGLAIYATWYDKTMIIMVSGVVLILVFIITLAFGIMRILNTASRQTRSKDFQSENSSTSDKSDFEVDQLKANPNYSVAEDITGLIIELVSILFAILGTFILFRYLKEKYAPVATSEAAAGAATS